MTNTRRKQKGRRGFSAAAGFVRMPRASRRRRRTSRLATIIVVMLVAITIAAFMFRRIVAPADVHYAVPAASTGHHMSPIRGGNRL